MAKLFQYLSPRFLLVISVLLLALTFQASDYRLRTEIQNFLFDNLNRIYPRAAGSDVVIVDIDEKSLDRPELGQWPWPRPLVAKLIDKLKDYQVKVVGFDMVFAEADNTSPEQVAKAWRKRGADETIIKDLVRLPSHDKIMAKSIRSAQNIVLGLNFEDTRRSGGFGFTPRPKANTAIDDLSDIQRYIYPFDTVANYPILSRFSAGEGHFYALPDQDGVYRRVPMVIGLNKKNIRQGADLMSRYFFYPSLSAEVLRFLAQTKDIEFGGLFNEALTIKGEARSFILPVDDQSNFYVWYARPNQDWYISAYDVLNDKVDAARLKDKVVLIGTSAIGLKDIRSTPMAPNRPGVEVHWNIIDQALQGAYLSRSQQIVKLEQLTLFVIGLIMALATIRFSLAGQSIVLIWGIALFLMSTWYGYVVQGLLIDSLYPSVTLFILYVISVVMGFVNSEQERGKIRDAFSLYIAPSYMKELAQDGRKLSLGGEEKIITTLFSDIRSFTTISEGLEPNELIELMNDFLTPLSDSIMAHRGTIDKYMGDAIMAFWNAPIDDEYHAYNSCKAALEMLGHLDQLNSARLAKDSSLLPLNAGIGINTGMAAVGNMGSRQRFAYSVLGDSVNLASRLESSTKFYGVNIIMGEACLLQPKVRGLALLELDQLRVKGRSAPERIYTLLGDEDEAAAHGFSSLKTLQDEMLLEYRAQNWPAAIEKIKICRQYAEQSGYKLIDYYSYFQARIHSLMDIGLPADWDGVYTADQK